MTSVAQFIKSHIFLATLALKVDNIKVENTLESVDRSSAVVVCNIEEIHRQLNLSGNSGWKKYLL